MRWVFFLMFVRLTPSLTTKKMERRIPFSNKINVNYLISGYSRQRIGKLSNNQHIPSSIINVIKYYYPKMNGYSFVWNIADHQSIQQIINPSSKQTFDSDVFDCGLSNKFFLQIQPANANASISTSSPSEQPVATPWSGMTPPPIRHTTSRVAPRNTTQSNRPPRTRQTARRSSATHYQVVLPRPTARRAVSLNDDDDDDDVKHTDHMDDTFASPTDLFAGPNQKQSNIKLNLMSFPLPPKYKYVIFQCELYWHELHREFSTIWRIKNPSTKPQHQPGFYGGHGYGGNRDYEEEKKDDNTYTKFGWTIHYDLHRYVWKQMTFECKINVLKVIPEGHRNVKRMQAYPYYDEDYNLNKKSDASTELYSYESLYDIESNKKLRFVWNINNTNGMVTRLTRYSEDKSIVQYHSDIYYDLFQLKVCRQGEKNEFMISIAGLPRNTHKMGVKIELFAMYSDPNNDDDTKMKIMSSIITFSYTSHTFIISPNKAELLMDLLRNYAKLSLLCTAIIIQKYDEENNTVRDEMKPVFNPKSNIETPAQDAITSEDHIKKEEETQVIANNSNTICSLDMESIREQIRASKEKIINLTFDTFIWHITADSDNGLLRKLKASIIKKQNQTFNSDVFCLLGHKWYISIYTRDGEDQYSHRRSRRGRNAQNTDDKPIVNMYANCLTKGCIDCKVCYHVLQTGARAEFYDSFDGASFRHRSWGSHAEGKSVLSHKANVIKALCTKEITIKVDISIISESAIGHKNDAKHNCKTGANVIKQEVIEWLTDVVHLSQYLDIFKREAIEDLEIVKRLTMDTLTLMGITKIGHQLKILHQIDIMKQKESS
eukprot:671698_1